MQIVSTTPSGVLLTVAYVGTHFHGFALQREHRTVAGELLGAVQAMDPSVRELRGVSRTDAGVHARGQLVALDPRLDIPTRGWVLGLGAHLPKDVAIRRAARVCSGFDPRGHAVRKHYRYVILRDACRDPFLEATAWRMSLDLDVDAMRAEASAAAGTHDFAAFRSSSDTRPSTERTIEQVRISEAPSGAKLLVVDVTGNAFLHNMVRILVGALVDVGRGKLRAGAIARALCSRQRSDLGVTAPPHGLCLESVELDAQAERTASWPEPCYEVSDVSCGSPAMPAATCGAPADCRAYRTEET